MRSVFVLRWLAMTGTILVLAGVTSAPAIAQPADVTYQIHLFDKSVGPGQRFGALPFTVSASKAVLLRTPEPDKVQFVFDPSGLPSGTFMWEPPSTPNECGSFVCAHYGGLYLTPEQPRHFLYPHIWLAGGTGTVGATGQLKISMKINDVVVATDTATITVGESVDLRYAAQMETLSAPFGEPLPLAVGVRNAGEKAIHGAYLQFRMPYGHTVVATTKHSNCNYDDDDGLLWCRFTGDLAPGATYIARPALRTRPDIISPLSPDIDLLWATPSDWEEYKAEVTGTPFSAEMEGTPGTGPALLLDRAPAAAGNGVAPQPDASRWDNIGKISLSITGEQKADLAAVGDTAAGQPGSVINVEVGVENRGAATATYGLFDFTPPTGTTVTTVPTGCSKEQNTYRCHNYDTPLAKGERFLVTFALRIDSATAGAPGKVVYLRLGPNLDADPTNNEADVVITREVLPITGAPMMWIVAVGVLVLGAGLVFLRLFRRRRPAELG